MAKSKVYFTDFRTKIDVPLTGKLQKLCRKAGIDQIDMEGKFVAIKMHFGELGNLAYLRPNYAKAVADLVKEKGGKPFLTDCNTLYPGSRKNALEHLDCANINGFNTVTTGCQILIADGLRGTDDVTVPVRNGEYCQEAYIGRALMDADIVISLTHFKGHEATGFGGAMKNLGMGGGSRAGKMQQHNYGKPVVDPDLCRNCKRCAKECGSDAITNDNANEVLCCKIAEYTQAICDGRPCFHISLVQDISPNCDCHAENDAPILPDVGMFASFDPVALDMACADACLEAEPIANSQLGDNLRKPGWQLRSDHFLNSNPNIRWREGLEHAEKIGLGTRDYELVRI
mgnify:CR=1 FL=1